MRKVTIELDDGWVLSHRNDDELPIDVLKSELSNVEGVKVNESSLTTLTLLCEEHNTNIVDRVCGLFKSHYPEDKDDVISFHMEDVEEKIQDDKADDTAAVDDSERRREQLEMKRKEMLSRLSEESARREGAAPADSRAECAVDKINALIGAAEFKALAKELAGISDEIKRTETYEVFTNRCYLFSIGDGCGLSTYLELLAKLISETGLCKSAARSVCEERIGEYRESFDPFDNAMSALGRGSEKNPKVLCIDISEWMDRTDNRYFKQFLRAVEKHADEFIVVFRVPFVDKDILARINHSLSDLLSVKPISFPPLGRDEIKACAEAEFKRLNFSVTKAAWACFFECIAEEKSDGKFYGLNTVKKVVRDFVYRKHIVNASKKTQSKQITANDVKALCDDFGDMGLSGMEMLDKLVGIESVKKRIEEIIAQIELSMQSGEQRPCIHMRFVGSPGTGKTTVARIIGKILKEKGVLRVGAFFEYAGRDFCGRYIGETAPKTASICRDAYGSVLFIDEAYSLYRGDSDSKDFGREAIDTLIAEMENHRNDFVVIMAGYTKDMETLMKGNMGLASRMPYIIEFPNFTREQLYDIFVKMAKGKFKCDKGLFDAARKFFDGLSEDTVTSKDFSNARYVRNLFERTWAKAAMRCQLTGKTQIVLTAEDFEHASADKEFVENVPKKTRIGFNI